MTTATTPDLSVNIAGVPLGNPLMTASGTCGYAMHVERAKVGRVVDEPFDQAQMNTQLVAMLDSDKQKQWADNALAYADEEDLYSRVEVIIAAIEARAAA